MGKLGWRLGTCAKKSDIWRAEELAHYALSRPVYEIRRVEDMPDIKGTVENPCVSIGVVLILA
jgi:hypothetical protein